MEALNLLQVPQPRTFFQFPVPQLIVFGGVVQCYLRTFFYQYMCMNWRSTPWSILLFGIYLMVIPGIGLMLVPEFLLDLFQLQHGETYWTARMMGMLAFVIGGYYYYIAQLRVEVLYPITVRLRALAGLFMVGLWLVGEVGLAILLFAAVDTTGALWTAWTLTQKEA